MRRYFIAVAAFVFMTNISAQTPEQPESYPVAPISYVVDNYFGIEVADPYRTLEDENSPLTKKWIDQEREVTENYLAQIPFRNAIRTRLTELNDYPKIGTPRKQNDGRYYWYENDGLRSQSVLMRSDSLGGKKEVFLDPNTLSDDGTVALTGVTQSKDGIYSAYTISRKGSDWTEIYVLETASGRLLPDHIEWAKFTSAEWFGDGFFYSAYPPAEDGRTFTGENRGHQVLYHKLGTPQSEDIVVFKDEANPLHFHSVTTKGESKVLFLSVSGQGVGNALKMKSLESATWLTDPWIEIESTQDNDIDPVSVRDGNIYYYTTKNAPRGHMLVASVDNPSDFEVFIPEQTSVLSSAQFTPEYLILTYDKDASTHAYLHKPDGTFIREIKFPGIGTASMITSSRYPEIFYTFTSYITPSQTYRYAPESGDSELINKAEIKGFTPSEYETIQIFYPSADGTMIPMFLTYKKGIKLNGKNPAYLYGYGGFNIGVKPSFSPNRVAWLENGGIYAHACLRGGSEYGDEWHEAGTKLKKMNVFNDFIAAAEYLINEGYTSPDMLAIEGGSNGGLLVGATTNLRPELFRVAIPRVGVMDMLRYHLFTIGWNWASDYGTSADSREMAEYLRSYSPTHNIGNTGKPYPAIMVTTADHDDRVVPAHSFKYAAALQAADTGDRVKIIRIDSNAGHGSGKPVGKVIDEYTDIYSFIFANMGIDPLYK